MLDSNDNSIKKIILRLILLSFAAFLIAFNIKAFLNNGGLVPGGFSGVTILLQRIFDTYMGVQVPYTVLYIPLNLFSFYLGFRYIGKKFTLYSLYVIVLSSILTDMLPNIPVTYDVLLIALFGAIVNGIAMTICLQAGACSGGTDFISIYASEKRGVDAWNYIFMANVVILVIAGILFGFDKALYSIVYQFTQTQLLNTLNKRYQKHTLWIITSKPDEVYQIIHDMTNHGATLFKGTGFYRQQETEMVYSVVGSDDVAKILKAVTDIDEHAFVNVQKTDLVSGNFYRRPTE
ncbi:MAG: YitT family protein [Clostridiales bacterium]|nr:YitT family protein [Candidatus Crickella merdequi]